MQPIAFQGYVKVGRTYYNSEKISKIKEHRTGEAPTLIFFDNGEVESVPEVKNSRKFIENLNTVSITNGILDYEA
ncbi:MAG: hypothetical protein IJW73_09760 [Candidatus Gastranaerophilales bacterium]|nr:hypothetical protein [Candidatus Gastranaerophilales bacterium]